MKRFIFPKMTIALLATTFLIAAAADGGNDVANVFDIQGRFLGCIDWPHPLNKGQAVALPAGSVLVKNGACRSMAAGIYFLAPVQTTQNPRDMILDEFSFIGGSIEALRRLKDAGYRICLISNQGGISKGYFTQGELDKLNKKMLEEIEKSGGKIDELYYCPHHDKDNCECRKPKTGLIEQAVRKGAADLKDTFIIGDSIRDIEAGKRMGMKTIFVSSGKTPGSKTKDWTIQPDYIKKDLLEAVECILKAERTGNA